MIVPFVGYHSETVKLGLKVFIAFHNFSQIIIIYNRRYLSIATTIHSTQNTRRLSS
jgi:hypothetical protein